MCPSKFSCIYLCFTRDGRALVVPWRAPLPTRCALSLFARDSRLLSTRGCFSLFQIHTASPKPRLPPPQTLDPSTQHYHSASHLYSNPPTHLHLRGPERQRWGWRWGMGGWGDGDGEGGGDEDEDVILELTPPLDGVAAGNARHW